VRVETRTRKEREGEEETRGKGWQAGLVCVFSLAARAGLCSASPSPHFREGAGGERGEEREDGARAQEKEREFVGRLFFYERTGGATGLRRGLVGGGGGLVGWGEDGGGVVSREASNASPSHTQEAWFFWARALFLQRNAVPPLPRLSPSFSKHAPRGSPVQWRHLFNGAAH